MNRFCAHGQTINIEEVMDDTCSTSKEKEELLDDKTSEIYQNLVAMETDSACKIGNRSKEPSEVIGIDAFEDVTEIDKNSYIQDSLMLEVNQPDIVVTGDSDTKKVKLTVEDNETNRELETADLSNGKHESSEVEVDGVGHGIVEGIEDDYDEGMEVKNEIECVLKVETEIDEAKSNVEIRETMDGTESYIKGIERIDKAKIDVKAEEKSDVEEIENVAEDETNMENL